MNNSQAIEAPRPGSGVAQTRTPLAPLGGILIVAILVRLLFILVLAPNPSLSGGDSTWYLQTGLQLMTNTLPGPIPAGPGFLVYLGTIQLLVPVPAVLQVTRLLNILWQTLFIIAVYYLGQRYIDRSSGVVAALVVALSPMFIIETGGITTETLYITLIFCTFALYAARQDSLTWRWAALIGIPLGVAALTRAVFLIFPAILIIHQIRLRGWRRGLQLGLSLLLTFCLTLLPWTVFNLVKWNRFVVAAGNDVMAFIWMGAKNEQRSSAQVDAQLGTAAQTDTRDQAFRQGVLDSLKNIPQYLKTRLSNWADSILQPHNTVYYPGESLKALASRWLSQDRSLAGLLALTRGESFWPKLVLYVFHFWALAFGAAGLWLNRRKFWVALPLFGYLGYTLAIHIVLIALPRYIFPVEPILILFAAYASLRLIDRLFRRPLSPVSQPAAA